MQVARDEEEAQTLTASCDHVRAMGGAVKWLDGDAARAFEPTLAADIVGAVYAKDEGQADPRKLRAALLNHFGLSGGERFAGRAVNVRKSGPTFHVTLADGQSIEAQQIVLANGAGGGLEVEGAPAAPVHPVKGESINFAVPPGALGRVVRGDGVYICPKADGQVVIGATEMPYRDDLIIDPKSIAALKRKAIELIPSVADWREVDRWAGLRPCTPDAAPILGERNGGMDGLFYALGAHRNGVLLAPVMAEIIACLILGRGLPIDIAPFSVERFASASSEGIRRAKD